MPETHAIHLGTLSQLTARGAWQLELAHERPEALFIWITRGQGLALFDGARRGVGAHNALFLPAGTLISIDLGRQGFAQALGIADTTGLNLPKTPVHLRTREAPAQMELNALLDAMLREQTAARPMLETAMAAHAALISVWLHRQIERQGPELSADTPARRILRVISITIRTPQGEQIVRLPLISASLIGGETTQVN